MLKNETAKATVIRGGRLLDIRAHRAHLTDILVAGDSIAEIGAPGLAAPAGATVVDARGTLLHPGLINAHTHAHGNLAKGMGDRWTLELLLTAGPWISGGRSLDDKYLSAKLGAVEMVLKGCTACYDLPFEWPAPTPEGLEAVGRAYAEVGMRAVLAPMVADRTFFEAIPALMEALTPAMQTDVETLRLAPGKTSVANMRVGNGLVDMRAMLDHRVNVGLGTDGANCADNLNMYEAMRLASFVSKAQRPDCERWVTTEEVAAAATEGSARTLGFGGRIGRLAVGYKADIAFLDLGHVNWIPLNDPTNQLVHTEDGGAVRHVMIGGRMIVQDRRVTTVDVTALAQEAELARQRLAGVNASTKELYERLAPVVGRFCSGLAHGPYHVTRYVGGV